MELAISFIVFILIVGFIVMENGFKDLKERIRGLQADVDYLVGRGRSVSEAEAEELMDELDDEGEAEITQPEKEKWDVPDFLKKNKRLQAPKKPSLGVGQVEANKK